MNESCESCHALLAELWACGHYLCFACIRYGCPVCRHIEREELSKELKFLTKQ